jgi:hypothetical protein
MYGLDKIQNQKVQEKLIKDPNSLSTTMLINPEVIGEMSPTLPYEFPKELIPKEICELQLKNLLSCLLDNDFDNVRCEDMQYTYYECKKWRDSLLFKRIKEWEMDFFNKKDENEKNTHLANLKVKKLELIDTFEKIEVTPSNRGRRSRVSYDIEQINWRILYLENTVNKLNNLNKNI